MILLSAAARAVSAPRPRAALRALVLGAGLAAAAPAQAAPGPGDLVHVFEPLADFDLQPQAQALANLLRLRIGDGGEFALASENPSFVRVAQAAQCDLRGFDRRALGAEADRGIDAACQKRVAARLGAKRYFWGHLYRGEGGRLAVKLHLWQAGQPARAATLPYEPNAREGAAAGLYLALVHPERVGEVALVARPPLAGELWVDGRAQGAYAAGGALTLLAGEHTFEVRREGQIVARAQANVLAARRVEATFAPVFVPRTDIDPTEGLVEPPRPARPAPPAWRRPAGFVGLGLGALALGAGVFSSLRVRRWGDDFAARPAFVAYREGVPRAEDACEAAARGVVSARPGAADPGALRDACASVGRYDALQYVFYGLGALSAGAGAYFLLSTPARPAPAGRAPPRATWHLGPSGGGGGAGVTLGGSF